VLASLGGGLVDGDSVRLDVSVDAGAAGLLGTQASTKVYRCPNGVCRQDTAARVAEDALLVLIPDPVACFATARYEQTTCVDLAASASLVLVDAYTSGRAARGERWDFHRYASRILVRRWGSPLLLDATVLDPGHGALRTRMGRFDAFATIVLVGPRVRALVQAAASLGAPVTMGGQPPYPPAPQAVRADLVLAASPLGDDGVLVRIAGVSVEGVTAAVRARLTGLVAVLGDDPFARKW
jgi:urease accessory protein